MIHFIKTASGMISNQNRVGFLKFSDNVTESKWLPYNWKESEFDQAVPSQFDEGYTNTPLALKTAKEMFIVGFIL